MEGAPVTRVVVQVYSPPLPAGPTATTGDALPAGIHDDDAPGDAPSRAQSGPLAAQGAQSTSITPEYD
jgi:hypothetical protein